MLQQRLMLQARSCTIQKRVTGSNLSLLSFNVENVLLNKPDLGSTVNIKIDTGYIFAVPRLAERKMMKVVALQNLSLPSRFRRFNLERINSEKSLLIFKYTS